MELSACHHIFFVSGGGKEVGWTHLIFVELLAVDDLWALDDVFRGDEWVLGDGLQG